MRRGLDNDTYSRRNVRGEGISFVSAIDVAHSASTSDENCERLSLFIVICGRDRLGVVVILYLLDLDLRTISDVFGV